MAIQQLTQWTRCLSTDIVGHNKLLIMLPLFVIPSGDVPLQDFLCLTKLYHNLMWLLEQGKIDSDLGVAEKRKAKLIS